MSSLQPVRGTRDIQPVRRVLVVMFAIAALAIVFPNSETRAQEGAIDRFNARMRCLALATDMQEAMRAHIAMLELIPDDMRPSADPARLLVLATEYYRLLGGRSQIVRIMERERCDQHYDVASIKLSLADDERLALDMIAVVARRAGFR